MPQITAPDGTTKYVPGVYFFTKVATTLPGPVNDFLVPVILAPAWEGHGYAVDAGSATGEVKPGASRYFRTADAAAAYYGYGSDMHVAFKNAQRHGLPGAWCVALNAFTRASVVADAAATLQNTIFAKKWGAPGGWIKVHWTAAAAKVTLTLLKNYAFLSANFTSGGKRLNLKGDTSWIQEGGTYSLGSNLIAVASVTVAKKGFDIDANGQIQWWVDLSSAFGSNLTTASYAMLGEYDTVNTKATTGTIGAGDGQGFIDAINRDLKNELYCLKHANFTGVLPDDVATATPIKEIAAWGTATAGTSPTPTATEVLAFFNLLKASAWEDFLFRYNVIPRSYLLVMGDSTSHGHAKSYAATERARGYPVSIDTGARWGDIVIAAGDDTDPKARAAALNSQDVALWGPGAEQLAPYLSFAPAAFGRRVSGGVGHNLTNDDLDFTSWETKWDEISLGQLTTLLRAGVGTVKFSTGRRARYRIAQGLNTLQSNSGLIWNVSTKDTWSIMQRDLADFVDRVQLTDLEEDLVGADAVNPNIIAAALRLRAERFLLKRGYLTEYTITSIKINDSGSGYDIQQSYKTPTTNDYMTNESTILVG